MPAVQARHAAPLLPATPAADILGVDAAYDKRPPLGLPCEPATRRLGSAAPTGCCRRTHKFAKGGSYASGQENGEDMCQILIGSLGYILLLNIPESQHHTFTSHLRCKSQHETGRICL